MMRFSDMLFAHCRSHQAAKAKRKEKEVVTKEDQKAKRARVDVKRDTVRFQRPKGTSLVTGTG